MRTSVAGMAPPEEEAWYLLSSCEDWRYRDEPDAAAWWELSIMIGHGQRLGSRAPGYPFFLVGGFARFRRCIPTITWFDFFGFFHIGVGGVGPRATHRYPKYLFDLKFWGPGGMNLPCPVLCFLPRPVMVGEQYAYDNPLVERPASRL